MNREVKCMVKFKYLKPKQVKKGDLTYYVCPFCGYEWLPRTPEPKECPRCHRYFYVFEVRKK